MQLNVEIQGTENLQAKISYRKIRDLSEAESPGWGGSVFVAEAVIEGNGRQFVVHSTAEFDTAGCSNLRWGVFSRAYKECFDKLYNFLTAGHSPKEIIEYGHSEEEVDMLAKLLATG